jgi:predicted DNA-binding transcriptional regulator AlpA
MTDFNHLPDSALLRERQLLPPQGPVPFGSASLWRKVKAGTFPTPIRLNDGRMTCWRWGDVRAWLETQGSDRKAA